MYHAQYIELIKSDIDNYINNKTQGTLCTRKLDRFIFTKICTCKYGMQCKYGIHDERYLLCNKELSDTICVYRTCTKLHVSEVYSNYMKYIIYDEHSMISTLGMVQENNLKELFGDDIESDVESL